MATIRRGVVLCRSPDQRSPNYSERSADETMWTTITGASPSGESSNFSFTNPHRGQRRQVRPTRRKARIVAGRKKPVARNGPSGVRAKKRMHWATPVLTGLVPAALVVLVILQRLSA